MSHYSDSPAAVAKYHQSTQDNHKRMSGCSHYRFMCPDCKKSKPLQGRKERGWKMGFRCAECHAAKSKLNP